jgi:hypothetical protein
VRFPCVQLLSAQNTRAQYSQSVRRYADKTTVSVCYCSSEYLFFKDVPIYDEASIYEANTLDKKNKSYRYSTTVGFLFSPFFSMHHSIVVPEPLFIIFYHVANIIMSF